MYGATEMRAYVCVGSGIRFILTFSISMFTLCGCSVLSSHSHLAVAEMPLLFLSLVLPNSAMFKRRLLARSMIWMFDSLLLLLLLEDAAFWSQLASEACAPAPPRHIHRHARRKIGSTG